jgi:hypothetical protein
MDWRKIKIVIIMQQIQFAKIKASQVDLDRLERAAEQLNKITRNSFRVARRGFRSKILVYETRDLLLAVVSNTARPTTLAVVGVTADDGSLFPSYVEADFAEVCALLGATTTEEVNEVRRLVKPWRDHNR